ncbi:hypothetical protein C2S51_019093 [Perilla frutescens var. frutescens]|nr:hypothetical protein C2S51_019093 [Perilla frutescens var. frutescens]
MAYVALLSALQALNKATQQDQFSNLFTIKQQITTLHEKLCFLQDFLENDPPAGGELIDPVEGRIREVSYLTEDIIEFHARNQISSWVTPVAVQRVSSLRIMHEKNKKVREVGSYEKLYQDFQKLVDEAVSIVEWVVVIRKSRKVEPLQFSDYTTGKTDVIGFDEDLMELKNQLCGGSANLQIIPLVGMAGIGKTTLAANVFHDPLIAYHFHVRAWTTITQDHRMPNILRGLLHSMTTPSEDSSSGCGELDELVYKSLKGRRYLVVLDDVWSIDAWDEMQFLNEEQSWNLLRGKVFGEEHCPLEFEETGRWIARNCRGLPLSIIVVAGLLKVNKIKHQWENIARDVSLTVTASDEHLPMKILSLSYNHLPHHLKPCFLSMGGFPENYEIPVFKLICLWVAEGFLKPMESKSLEEVAEVYLEDLVKRSLVLVTKKRSNTKPRFCSIHDLLRELCIRKARDEKFLHPMNGIQESMDQKRRVWFSKCVEWFHFMNANASTTCSPHLRSVFCCSYNDKVITGFKQLKVLHILEVYFESFPVEILQLLHLKFLAFTNGSIRYCTLPPSLPKLQYLQTLIVSSSVKFSEGENRLVVPFPIWDMPQLRHLVFLNITLSASPFPARSPFLERLQTLSRLKNFRFTREAIEMIPNLKKLKAVYTGDPCSLRSEYELNNLINLNKLETLNLSFLPSIRIQHVSALRFGLQLPLMIKKLTLRGCRISWKDMSIIGSLMNLEVLKLRYLSVVGEEWEAMEGEFPMLRFLLMERLDLSRWMAEATHFMSLECLIIRHCSRLENVPCGIGEIPTLQMIEV